MFRFQSGLKDLEIRFLISDRFSGVIRPVVRKQFKD